MVARRWTWQIKSPLIIAALTVVIMMVSLIAGTLSTASADTLHTNLFINAGGDTAESFVASTDNPFFINKMADTFATLRSQGKLYWESYFNLDGCTFQITDGCNPNASAAYV